MMKPSVCAGVLADDAKQTCKQQFAKAPTATKLVCAAANPPPKKTFTEKPVEVRRWPRRDAAGRLLSSTPGWTARNSPVVVKEEIAEQCGGTLADIADGVLEEFRQFRGEPPPREPTSKEFSFDGYCDFWKSLDQFSNLAKAVTGAARRRLNASARSAPQNLSRRGAAPVVKTILFLPWSSAVNFPQEIKKLTAQPEEQGRARDKRGKLEKRQRTETMRPS